MEPTCFGYVDLYNYYETVQLCSENQIVYVVLRKDLANALDTIVLAKYKLAFIWDVVVTSCYFVCSGISTSPE